MERINDLQLGKAGEYLVCADLILMGHIAFLSEQGLHYDVVADLKGKLARVQVKTTSEYRNIPQRAEPIPSYLFHCRRCGKGGRQSYKDTDIDIMAFVAIKDRVIGYLPIEEVRTTMIFRSRKCKYIGNRGGIYLEDCTFERALDPNRKSLQADHGRPYEIKRNGEPFECPT